MTRDRDPLEVYNNYYVPMVVEQSARGERGYDIWSRLLKERIVDRKSTRLNSSHSQQSRMPSSA